MSVRQGCCFGILLLMLSAGCDSGSQEIEPRQPPPAQTIPATEKPSSTRVTTKSATPQSPPTAEQSAQELDLSVPEELLVLDPDTWPNEFEPILPALPFNQPARESPFELNGRLISNERIKNYWESIEGAEIHFTIKQ